MLVPKSSQRQPPCPKELGEIVVKLNFILYVIKTKYTMGVQEKIEISSMSQRPRFSRTKISGYLSLSTNIKQQ